MKSASESPDYVAFRLPSAWLSGDRWANWTESTRVITYLMGFVESKATESTAGSGVDVAVYFGMLAFSPQLSRLWGKEMGFGGGWNNGSIEERIDVEYPVANTVEEFAENLRLVRERMDAAALKVGRNPQDVRLLPVSKTIPEERLRLAIEAGAHQLGENKVQEAKRKFHNLSDVDVKWSVIGHLQTNKAKDVAAFASEFHALDSVRLAEALDRRLEKEGRSLEVYLQVNTSGEESKYGVEPSELLDLARQVNNLSSLRVRGLMTLAIFSDDHDAVRKCFQVLRSLRDEVRDTDPDLIGLGELSMGMSGDYEIAIEEGANVVRVGQAIFGPRTTTDADYWPTGAQGGPTT